jgi:hypothetical protein
MNRSISLLSALALSSASLLALQLQEAKAITIAFDCFERGTEKLVARSAVDMTSTAISCLPVPGSSTDLAGHDQDSHDDGDVIDVNNTWPGENEDDDGWDNEGDFAGTEETWPDTDTHPDHDGDGSSTSDKVADILGDLIVKGINDLLH